MSAKAYLTMEDALNNLTSAGQMASLSAKDLTRAMAHGGFIPYVAQLSEGEKFRKVVKEIAEQNRLKEMLHARIDRLFEEGIVQDVSDFQPVSSTYNTLTIYWVKR